MIEFYRPRGASPSLGLGLGGAPHTEGTNQRPLECAEFPDAISEGCFPFT